MFVQHTGILIMFQSTASSHTHKTIILFKYNKIHHTTQQTDMFLRLQPHQQCH